MNTALESTTVTVPAFNRYDDIIDFWGNRRPNHKAFQFYYTDSDRTQITFGELALEVTAFAARLSATVGRQQRVALIYRPGIDFIIAFLACLYSGVVAVPVNPPKSVKAEGNRYDRLMTLLRDIDAALVLVEDKALITVLLEVAASQPGLDTLSVVSHREFSQSACSATIRRPTLSDIAFIQYTSGSTSSPKGVVLSHGNLMANEALIKRKFNHNHETSVVAGWLPLFHDMGLIGIMLQPLYLGVASHMMPPEEFIKRPSRWLQLISECGATTSGGPSFGYEHCIKRINRADLAGLDLSNWQVAFNGAEMANMAVMRQFAETFAPWGFRFRSFLPCYGLAEATLCVTAGNVAEEPSALCVDRASLQDGGQIADGDPAAKDSVLNVTSVGSVDSPTEVIIVDPHTRIRLDDNRVGEIWVCSDSVSHQYFNRPEETANLLQAKVAGDDQRSYLRTGDTGFIRHNNLYVVGREKNVIIVRGRNYFAEDIEQVVIRDIDHDAIQDAVAFGCSSRDDEPGEQLVIMVELTRERLANFDPAAFTQDIQQKVIGTHGVRPHSILFAKPLTIPKTTSGKPQRSLCRKLYESKQMDEHLLR